MLTAWQTFLVINSVEIKVCTSNAVSVHLPGAQGKWFDASSLALSGELSLVVSSYHSRISLVTRAAKN